MWDVFDMDRDGKIQLTEALQVVALIENSRGNEEKIAGAKVAFLLFDTNKDGFIDPLEISRTLRILLGLDVDGTLFVNFYDLNKDGKLDFEEVSKMWNNTYMPLPFNNAGH